MTTALVVRQDPDWVGFVVVMGILALSLLFAFGTRRLFGGEFRIDLDQLHDHDHVDCSNPDCDHTICRCSKPAECVGTTTLGCPHGEGLCWDCRLACWQCSAEWWSEQGLASEAGR